MARFERELLHSALIDPEQFCRLDAVRTIIPAHGREPAALDRPTKRRFGNPGFLGDGGEGQGHYGSHCPAYR